MATHSANPISASKIWSCPETPLMGTGRQRQGFVGLSSLEEDNALTLCLGTVGGTTGRSDRRDSSWLSLCDLILCVLLWVREEAHALLGSLRALCFLSEVLASSFTAEAETGAYSTC